VQIIYQKQHTAYRDAQHEWEMQYHRLLVRQLEQSTATSQSSGRISYMKRGEQCPTCPVTWCLTRPSVGHSRFLKSVKSRHRNGPLLVKVFIKPDPALSLRTYHSRLNGTLQPHLFIRVYLMLPQVNETTSAIYQTYTIIKSFLKRKKLGILFVNG